MPSPSVSSSSCPASTSRRSSKRTPSCVAVRRRSRARCGMFPITITIIPAALARIAVPVSNDATTATFAPRTSCGNLSRSAGVQETRCRPASSSLHHSPRRYVRPVLKRLRGKVRRFSRMAPGARIRYFQRGCCSRGNEFECVSADIDIRNRLLDFRHVAVNAFVTGAAGFVVSMGLDGRRTRAVGRIRSVALKTEHVGRFHEIGIIPGAMHIMAAEAAYPVSVHLAGDEIVPLHAVLMRRSIRKMGERLFAQPVLFQLPEFLQIFAHLKPYRPIVILAFDGVPER